MDFLVCLIFASAIFTTLCFLSFCFIYVSEMAISLTTLYFSPLISLCVQLISSHCHSSVTLCHHLSAGYMICSVSWRCQVCLKPGVRTFSCVFMQQHPYLNAGTVSYNQWLCKHTHTHTHTHIHTTANWFLGVFGFPPSFVHHFFPATCSNSDFVHSFWLHVTAVMEAKTNVCNRIQLGFGRCRRSYKSI